MLIDIPVLRPALRGSLGIILNLDEKGSERLATAPGQRLGNREGVTMPRKEVVKRDNYAQKTE